MSGITGRLAAGSLRSVSPALAASVAALLAILGAWGCGRVHRPPSTPAAVPAEPAPSTIKVTPPEAQAQDEDDSTRGVFHTVEPGQTLWRIARAYGVPVEEVARVNEIGDPSKIEIGQALFIPGADAPLEVAPFPAPPPSAARVPVPDSEMAARDASFTWPVAGAEVISYFGAPRRHRRHAGIDLRGGKGQEILAARGGVVILSSATRTGYGRLVILDHGNGLESLYAHNQDLLVKVGDTVEKGQPIARMGRTGNATTPHCHFEIRRDKVAVDPLPYLSRIAEVRR